MKLDLKKYAIEFAVIFISITLSFLVEEWRTKSQEANLAREFLRRLKAELVERKVSSQGFLDFNRARIVNNQKLASNFRTREIRDDSLFQYIIESEGTGEIEPDLASWESLKSSGIFASMNPQLIDSVNSLLVTYKMLNYTNKYLNDLAIQTWPQFLVDIPPGEVTEQWISFFKKNNVALHDIPLMVNQSAGVRQVDMNKFLTNPIAIDYFFTKALLGIGIEKAFRSLPEKESRLIALIEREIEE